MRESRAENRSGGNGREGRGHGAGRGRKDAAGGPCPSLPQLLRAVDHLYATRRQLCSIAGIPAEASVEELTGWCRGRGIGLRRIMPWGDRLPGRGGAIQATIGILDVTVNLGEGGEAGPLMLACSARRKARRVVFVGVVESTPGGDFVKMIRVDVSQRRAGFPMAVLKLGPPRDAKGIEIFG